MKKLIIVLILLYIAGFCYGRQTTENYNLIIPSSGETDVFEVLSQDYISIDAVMGIISSDSGDLRIEVNVISNDIANNITTAGINNTIYINGVIYAKTDTGIENAIAALPASGGRIVLTEGTYAIASTISVTDDDLIIEGMGNSTVLKVDNSSDASVIALTGVDNVTVKNFGVDGNSATQAFSSGIILQSTCSDIRVYDIDMTDIKNNGITMSDATDVIIQGCRVDLGAGGGDNILVGDDCSKVTINGCITSNTQAGSTNGIGVFSSAGSTTTDVVITNCVSYGNNGNGINVESEGTVKRVTVTNCAAMENGASGFSMIETSGTLSEVIFADCVSWNNGTIGTYVDGADNIQITSCQNMSEDTYGIQLNDTSGAIIMGNIVNDVGNDCFYVTGDSSNIIISNNTFKNANNDAGIKFFADAGKTISDVQITNNQLYDDQATATQDYGIFKWGNGTTTNIQSYNNYYAGHGVANTSGLSFGTVSTDSTVWVKTLRLSADTSATGITIGGQVGRIEILSDDGVVCYVPIYAGS